MSILFFQKGKNGFAPTRGTENSAGFDLYSAVDVVIKKWSSQLITTDIKIVCPKGTYGRIAGRSGLAFHRGIDVAVGVIDSDYRGTIKVLLRNHSDNDYQIHKGNSIAQLILEKYAQGCQTIEVRKLNDTERGAKGFGSTGI